MKRFAVKIGSAICAMVVVFGLMSSTAAARGLGDVQGDINAKKEQLNAIEEKIKKNKNNKSAAEKELKEYEAHYEELLALIDEQEIMIEKTAAEVDYKGEQLSNTIINLQENQDMYGERLRAIYQMNSNSVMLSMLLQVDDYADFVQISNAMQRISERDTQVLQELAIQRDEYETQKAELEVIIDNLADELDNLQADRDWCNEKIGVIKGNIASANLAIAEGQEEKQYTEDEIKQLQQEYAAIFAASQQKGSQQGDGTAKYDGPMQWPVNGYGRVTSYYGDPRGNTGYHYGIDVPAPTGTAVLAAAPGTVITSTWHYSYGNYMIIDHGGGMRTLYAHCSELYVSGGEVEKGQTIAAVGNTGDSYGSHLHFEVHDGGTRQNPLGSGYLTW